MRILVVLGLIFTVLPTGLRAETGAPAMRYSAGAPVTFATHDQLTTYHFAWGPSDGTFGAIPAGGGRYTFYGPAGSAFACTHTSGPNEGVFTFTGTLDRIDGGDGCKKLFGPNPGPAGWAFARNYAGGGQLVRFASGGTSGWLMPFHGEYWWRNPARSDGKCEIAGGVTDCFYSALGLAVSTDGARSFKVAGEILQPSLPRTFFMGSGKIMGVGYGSLVVADANGKHLDNPPADPGSAYFYLFYGDFAPDLRGGCAVTFCAGVARALYGEVVAAALSGDPHRVAKVFHKYDGASPDAWTQPATSDTLDDSRTAGVFTPLWTDEGGVSPNVIYDRAFDVYLAAYKGTAVGLEVRASRDLIHWSRPIGAPIQEPGRALLYPTLLGETEDPIVGGQSPRLYFISFPAGSVLIYKNAVFESVQLRLSSP